MEGLFPCRAFVDFGPNSLGPGSEPAPLESIAAGRSAILRARLREQCPRRPGVYGMLTDKQELIYIGKAKSLRARLLSYFRPKSRDPKAGRILKHTSTIVWEYAASEFAALLRELELIRRWRPRFNVQGQPRYTWPASFALARAYVDQLERSKGLSEARISGLRQSLTSAEGASAHFRGGSAARLGQT